MAGAALSVAVTDHFRKREGSAGEEKRGHRRERREKNRDPAAIHRCPESVVTRSTVLATVIPA